MRAPRRRALLLISLGLIVGLTATGWWLFSSERHDPPKVTLRSSQGSVNAIAYSPDGRYLAVANGPNVTLWDRSTWQPVRTIESPTAEHVSSIAYSPDGASLALGCFNEHVSVWDTSRGDRRLILREEQKDSDPRQWFGRRILSLCFSRDGRTLAAAHTPVSSDGNPSSEVRLWDTTTGNETRVLRGQPQPKSSSDSRPDWVMGIAFSPDGTLLASGDMRGKVKLWNAADGSHQRDLPRRGSVLALAFSPKGGVLAYGGEWSDAADVATLLDLASGLETRFPGSSSNNIGTYVSCLAFSPDGRTLATGEMMKDGKGPYRVRLWDVSTRTLIGVYWCECLVNAVAFSRDGTELAAGCEAVGPERVGEVRIWDVPPKHDAAR
jgi:WD40 repeat protein